jgi:hypothetical protein
MRWITTMSIVTTLLSIFGLRLVTSAAAQPPANANFNSITARQLVILDAQGNPVLFLNTLQGGLPHLFIGRQNSNVEITPLLIEQLAPSGAQIRLGFQNQQSPFVALGGPNLKLELGFANNLPALAMDATASGEHLGLTSQGMTITGTQNSSTAVSLSGLKTVGPSGYSGITPLGFSTNVSNQNSSTSIVPAGLKTFNSSGYATITPIGFQMMTADAQEGLRLNVDGNGLTSKRTNAGKEEDWPPAKPNQ